MLRGPEVSSQAGGLGLWVSGSSAWLHEYAWRTDILRLPPLASQSDTRGGGSRTPLELPLLHYTSAAGRALLQRPSRSGIPAHCVLFVFAGSCHIRPVSDGPGEICTEPLVRGEAIKRDGDTPQTYLAKFACMCVCCLVKSWENLEFMCRGRLKYCHVNVKLLEINTQ